MKKVFIVYASAGAGHQKAAEAVYEYLLETRQDLELKLINILDYCSPLVKFLYSEGYIFLISKHRWLWYFLYQLSYFFVNSPFRFLTDYKSAKGFVKLLKAEKPEIVFSTHFLPSSIITVFKKRHPADKPRLIAIITDYNLHPYWVGEGVDLYIISCDFVKDGLLKNGVSSDKIKIYGIPVKQKFYLSSERKAVADKLGVEPYKFTILIITGTIGIGPIEEIVESLADTVQLLVVCGKNKRLFGRLSRMSCPALKVYPLINYVEELMSVSDIVLTKAGGLTISESLAKGLPMVFFSSIPGLETSNEEVICKYGAGIRVKSGEEIKDIVLSFKSTPGAYQKIKQNVDSLRKAAALKDISSEIPS
jgi:processive 1,2-diacylglycerol beta-glucosyltransferase